MFKTTEELKAFILWAASQGIKELTVGDVKVNFWMPAMPDESTAVVAAQSHKDTEEKNTSSTLVDNEGYTEEDLYFSVN